MAAPLPGATRGKFGSGFYSSCMAGVGSADLCCAQICGFESKADSVTKRLAESFMVNTLTD
jgi:hypothetical protein